MRRKVAVGLGWAAGFAGPALVVGGLLGLGLVASLPGSVRTATAANGSGQQEPSEMPWVGSWFGIVLVLALEFAFVFWATDYMDTVGSLPQALAAGLTAMFFVGMAAARALGVLLLPLLDPRRRALLGGLTIAALGFAAFWVAPFVAGTPLWSGLGLLIAGAGVAYLFPLSFLGLVGILVGGTDRASARASLASGVAIGTAPLLLGIAADRVGLTTALLIIPILILAAAVNVAAVYRRAWFLS